MEVPLIPGIHINQYEIIKNNEHNNRCNVNYVTPGKSSVTLDITVHVQLVISIVVHLSFYVVPKTHFSRFPSSNKGRQS